MKNHDRTWPRLAAAARIAIPDADESAPYGFSTRVAALGMAAPVSAPAPWAVLEKLAVRGLIAACACSLAAVAFGYAAWSSAHENDVASGDAVADVLDLTS